MAAQTYETHGRIVPLYHYVTFGILTLNVFYRGYLAATAFSTETLISALVAVALFILCFYARLFPLAAQDRVIRLEERLRMRELLPPDLQPRIGEFTVGQLIALRFASDEELPGLARRVLDEGLRDRKAIKKMVRHWRPDLHRV